jgi:hypothetical protein
VNAPVVIGGFRERWEASGLAALTGHPDETVLPRRDFLGRLDDLLWRVEDLGARFGVTLGLGHSVFTGRAALMGLSRRGQVSCSGTCRLIEAADGWIAVNLARPEDVELVPAWFCREVGDPWAAIEEAARLNSAARLAERAAMLGIPTAGIPLTLPSPPGGEGKYGSIVDAGVPSPQRGEGQGEGGREAAPGRTLQGHCGVHLLTPPIPFSRHPAEGRDPVWTIHAQNSPSLDPGLRRDDGWRKAPLVVDLSSLWAGPLCGHLLTRIGCRVIKVESTDRPDGARFGSPAFFRKLHEGQEFLALDLASPDGRARLRDLILSADVVIEGSRPRALLQLGIDRNEIMAQRPSLIWASITAHGRADNRVGFGDDAAAAAGLLAWDRVGRPVFVGDAIADPIAGLTAAAGAMEALLRGEGGCVDVSLSGAAAWVAAAAEVAPC